MQINEEQAAMIQQYSEITGTPSEEVVHEALEEFLSVCIPARLRSLARNTSQA